MSGNIRRILVGSGILIGGYLALVHFSGFSSDVNALSSGAGGFVAKLQGR